MRVKNSLGDLVLLSLEKSIEGYINFEDFAYNTHKYFYGYPRNIKTPSLLKAIQRLRKNGFIEFLDEEKLLIKMTKIGQDKAILARLKVKDELWDGKWRVVIFDIPEEKRKVRDLFRSKLKQWGFIPWQKSVWASKKNCTRQLRDFIKDLGIRDWVTVLESENIA